MYYSEVFEIALSSNQREVNEIFDEVADLAMNWVDYSMTCGSDEEFDSITIMAPEWIKLMDDCLTSRDFECDNITPSDNGKIRLFYLREKQTDWYVAEREREGKITQ
jgi:hypothetical protein